MKNKRMKDITGFRYGRLVAMKPIGTDPHNNAIWLCKCKCGNTKVASLPTLTQGFTRSCGCISKERPNNTKHGERGTRLYGIWKSMRERCNTKSNSNYHNYGGRGICVYKEWDDYLVFKKWALSNGYKNHLSIDRINVNGNYEPNNCRWATRYQQARNKRNTLYVCVDGKTKALADWADDFGVDYKKAYSRLKGGLCPVNLPSADVI